MNAPAGTGSPSDGVAFEGVHCRLTLWEPVPHVCVIRFAGRDVGEFGEGPIQVLSSLLKERRHMALFIDARDVPGASVDVSSLWAQWMRKHQVALTRVHFLGSSQFVKLTARVVRNFSGLGSRMVIHADAAAFDQELSRAVARQSTAAEESSPESSSG